MSPNLKLSPFKMPDFMRLGATCQAHKLSLLGEKHQSLGTEWRAPAPGVVQLASTCVSQLSEETPWLYSGSIGGQLRKKTSVKIKAVRVKFLPVREADGPDSCRSRSLFSRAGADMLLD